MKKRILFGACAALLMAACCQTNKKCEESAGSAPKTTSQTTEAKAKVLVAVDVQRDFFDPSGSLYVPGSEALPEKIAAIAGKYDAVIFTLDWHPGNHCSFKAQGGMWPSHCVAYTQGAGLPDEFAGILAEGESKVQLFFKGNLIDKEQYGAFENLPEGVIRTWLENCDSVDVCGIAGDYCVKESTANILKIVPASKVTMLTDCIRSIDDGSALAAFVKENGLSSK
jgi:Amidases related to nicotinamidase